MSYGEFYSFAEVKKNIRFDYRFLEPLWTRFLANRLYFQVTVDAKKMVVQTVKKELI